MSAPRAAAFLSALALVTLLTGSRAGAITSAVDANIQISPATAINAVARVHALTGHVNVDPGSGTFANAPDGTVIAFALTNTGGATAGFVGSSSCTTSGGTGSCTVSISSTTPGTTTVHASTTVTVNATQLTRATGDGQPGDGPDAVKLWANATVRTDILNANNTVVTTVPAGTVVHDRVQVARTPDTPPAVPDPTGTVVFHRYSTIDCTGPSVDQTVALATGNPATAVSNEFAVTAAITYRADYGGDADYPAGQGACEPLTVTPVPEPAIAIVVNPKAQTVMFLGTAKFRITVTNTGNTTLTNVHVTDPLAPACNRTPSQIPALETLAPGAKVTYNCARPNVRSNFTNVATAVGTPPEGPSVTATDTAPVEAQGPYKPPPHARIAIVVNPKSQRARAGLLGTASAFFRITVTNAGNLTLINVTVTDRKSPRCNRTKAQIRALAAMAPGTYVAYSCQRTGVEAPYTNVATATGRPINASRMKVTATDSAKVKTKKVKTKRAAGTHKLIVVVKKTLAPAAEKKLEVLVLISQDDVPPGGATAVPGKPLTVLLNNSGVYRIKAEIQYFSESSCEGSCAASYRISGSADHKLEVVPSCQPKASALFCSRVKIVKVY